MIEEQFLIAFAYCDLRYAANGRYFLLSNVFDIEEVGHQENAAARQRRRCVLADKAVLLGGYTHVLTYLKNIWANTQFATKALDVICGTRAYNVRRLDVLFLYVHQFIELLTALSDVFDIHSEDLGDFLVAPWDVFDLTSLIDTRCY